MELNKISWCLLRFAVKLTPCLTPPTLLPVSGRLVVLFEGG